MRERDHCRRHHRRLRRPLCRLALESEKIFQGARWRAGGHGHGRSAGTRRTGRRRQGAGAEEALNPLPDLSEIPCCRSSPGATFWLVRGLIPGQPETMRGGLRGRLKMPDSRTRISMPMKAAQPPTFLNLQQVKDQSQGRGGNRTDSFDALTTRCTGLPAVANQLFAARICRSGAARASFWSAGRQQRLSAPTDASASTDMAAPGLLQCKPHSVVRQNHPVLCFPG